MQILMKNLAAGPAGVLLPGKSYDVPDAQGAELVAGNYASPVAAKSAALLAATTSPAVPPAVEHATAPPPPAQHATAPATLGKRKR